MSDYIIRVENLVKRFGELVTVNDISFSNKSTAPGDTYPLICSPNWRLTILIDRAGTSAAMDEFPGKD